MVDSTDESLNKEQGKIENSQENTNVELSDNIQAVQSNITNIKLEDELKKSFIDYAMSVIVDRALPDVRDGLKPVHRRVLFDMYDLKVWYSGQTKKSARIVGDVIGRFHPHGDAAVYETIVRMTQWFSMRAPLIFGQGNFGNIDGDSAAAMRYTEVKMTKISEMLLADIDKDTVDTYPNYDGNEYIPEVLPTRFPNLLVNGSSGIAVGLATNIPPHNLGEVIDGAIAYLNDNDITIEQLMQYIPGPDFPTGGYIVGNQGIMDAYKTGKGRCIIRAKTHTETDKNGKKTIYVDEIPYVVSKSAIIKQIADLLRDKKLEGVADVYDLSDKVNLVRIAIELKRDAYEEAILNNLYEKTSLQSSFPINMVALVHNHPKQLNLKDIISEFVKFRREVVTRRTVYLLRQDRKKAFLNEGLIVAKANINKIVDMIRSSENTEDAKNKLMSEPWDGTFISSIVEYDNMGNNICTPLGINGNCGLQKDKYFLSEEQAKAILAMQLQRLTHLASDEIVSDYKQLILNIKKYLDILNNPEVMKKVIYDELIEVKEQFADPRRSEFTQDLGKFSKSDLIAKQDVIITLSEEGYIKYQDISTFEAQKHGGKGKSAAKLKEEDAISKIIVSNTHHIIMCFTNMGRVFCSYVYDMPTSDNRTWRGRPIQNIFDIEQNESVTAILSFDKFDDEHFIFMATKNGRVKKTPLLAFKNFLKRNNSAAIKALNLNENDELVDVAITSGDDDIYLFTSNGKAIHFCEFYKKSTQDDADASDGVDEQNDDSVVEEAEIQEDTQESNDTQDSQEGSVSEIVKVKDRHAYQGIRPSSRASGTILGIRLAPGASLVSLIVVNKDETEQVAFIATKNGYGKKFYIGAIPPKSRGTKGMIIIKRTGLDERNGPVVGVYKVDPQSDIILVTNQGTLTRFKSSELGIYSRYSSGVIIMRPGNGEFVKAMQSIPEEVVRLSNEAQLARAIDKQEQKDLENNYTEQQTKEEE